jgi:hypothetical protein
MHALYNGLLLPLARAYRFLKFSPGGSGISTSLFVRPFVLMNISCARHIATSFWRIEVVQAIEELENRLRKETKSGWKDNATSVLRKEVATRSRRRENSRVLNQKT